MLVFCFVTLDNFTLTFNSQINGFKALFHMKYFKYILLSSLLLFTSCEEKSSGDSVVEEPQEDTFLKFRNGKFVFNNYPPLADKPINVYTYLPVEGATNLPVIFVMHGHSRSVISNCGDWSESADLYKFTIICPEFNEADFPTSWNYQNGMMVESSGQFRDSTTWTYNLIEEIFSFLKENNVTTHDTYGIYGFSGGGQFVHRYAFFTKPKRAKLIISAGSGWYTIPNYTEKFPYGLNNSPFEKNNLTEKLQLPMIVMVGENDTNPYDSDLRKTVEANRQGSNRVERANYYYNSASQEASNIGIDLNWSYLTVENVGHSSSGMAPQAAELFFNDLNN